MYNYDMGTSPPDIYSQIYGYPNYIGQQQILPSYSYENGLGRTSPLPRRRYSIGGLPSADYCSLTQNHNPTTSNHLTNLINETSKSISRSTEILNRRLLNEGISSYPTLNIGEQSHFLNDNIVPMSSNFYSHPNINTQQPNYNSNYYNESSNYFPKFKPSSDYLFSKPIYSNSNAFSNQTNLLSHNSIHSNHLNHHHHPHSILSSQPNKHLYSHQHHASNPAISQSSNLLSHTTNYPPFSSGYINQHFDHHHYQIAPMSKLDLDYSKPAETKRQVSFKFDVDRISIDS